jgi:hypothetical protein
MTNEKSKQESFDEVVLPVIKWLCENSHPHSTILVTPTNAELLEGIISTGEVTEFIKD